MGYIVDEILPEIEDTVELFAYDQEDEEFQVLIPRESLPEDSPITERPTNLQSYTDLVTNNSKLKVEIEDKFLIKKPVEKKKKGRPPKQAPTPQTFIEESHGSSGT